MRIQQITIGDVDGYRLRIAANADEQLLLVEADQDDEEWCHVGVFPSEREPPHTAQEILLSLFEAGSLTDLSSAAQASYHPLVLLLYFWRV